MSFVITDRPLQCCGMLMAHGWSTTLIPEIDNVPKVRYPSCASDYQPRFDKVDSAMEEFERNCALISLSVNDQLFVIELAKKDGYQIVFEFYNPNSGSQVVLMTKVKYQSKEDYIDSHPKEEEN